MRRRRGLVALLLVLLSIPAAGCGEPDPGTVVRVEIPEGAGVLAVGRRLEEAGLVSSPRLFALYVALRGAEGRLQAGHYRFRGDAGWGELVDAMVSGRVETVPVTIPEGFTLERIAPLLAELAGVPADSVLSLGRDSALARSLGVPGPTLEGYLFPETYRFARGVPTLRMLRAMVRRHLAFWGPRERARADSLGLDLQEAVTLASIVEAEARVEAERPLIAAVYLNRLERGMRLQADPTVQYALEERRERLLFRDIDAVADHPYNTYTHAGLPPGPIGSPGEASLRAVLRAADVPYLFFVARPDGSHVFTRTAAEHAAAIRRIRGGSSGR